MGIAARSLLPKAPDKKVAPRMSPLNSQIKSALEQNPYFSGRNLRFETSEGRVALHGTVRSFYQKQMAQESLKGLDGVAQVDNHLEVSWL